MARVDFYVLSQSGEQARQAFACRLVEKAYRLDNTVLIHVRDRSDAERMDALLWTFRDGSFVPHHIVDAGSTMQSPVTIACTAGCDEMKIEKCDLLINLCDNIPAIADSFPRIAELVSSDTDCKQSSRKRFAAYRDQGHQIDTHNI